MQLYFNLEELLEYQKTVVVARRSKSEELYEYKAGYCRKKENILRKMFIESFAKRD